MPAPLIFLLTSDALQALQCADEPVGWPGLKEVLLRDEKRHGITLTGTAELTFVKAAAAYLRTVYEGGPVGTGATARMVPAAGVEGVVSLTVYEQDPNELRPVELFRGRVDFLTYESTLAGVSCRFKEGGLATVLLAREQVAVDLLGHESAGGVALSPATLTTAALHSQETLQRYEAKQVAQPATSEQITLRDNDGYSAPRAGSALLRIGFPDVAVNEFGIEGGFGLYYGDPGSAFNVPVFTAKGNGVYDVDFAFTVDERIETEQTFLLPPLVNLTYQIDIKYELRIRRGGVLLAPIPLAPAYHYDGTLSLLSGFRDARDHVTTVSYRDSLPLIVGDTLTLYAEFYVHGLFSGVGVSYTAIVKTRYQAGAYFRLRAVTTTPPTACPGLLAHEALARVFEAATDTRDVFYSEYFGRPDLGYATTGPGALRLLTSGFQLRGFPLPTAPLPALVPGDTDPRKSLYATAQQLYDGLNGIDCLGLGLETRADRPIVRVEPRAHFYQPADVLTLGAVSDLKQRVHPALLHNAVEVGYPHWQSGAPEGLTNGLDEFNAPRSYSLPLTQVKATYSATSNLIAAGYLIEAVRRDRFVLGASKEGKADGELFVIALRFVPAHTVTLGGLSIPFPAGYASSTNENFATVSGIFSPPTTYNLALSPGRMLRAHGPWIRAGLAAQTAQRLLPAALAGNPHLASQQLSEAAPLREAGPVLIADLTPPVLLAETYEFTLRLRRGEMAALRANPYGRISFLDAAGTLRRGYLLRCEREVQSGKATLTLLRAA